LDVSVQNQIFCRCHVMKNILKNLSGFHRLHYSIDNKIIKTKF